MGAIRQDGQVTKNSAGGAFRGLGIKGKGLPGPGLDLDLATRLGFDDPGVKAQGRGRFVRRLGPSIGDGSGERRVREAVDSE